MSRFLVLLLVLMFWLPSRGPSDTIKIYTEDFAPYSYENDEGRITGISTEIVREILKRLNHPETIEISPWSRAYQLVQKTENTMLYSTTRTEIREDLFKWVGPLVPNNTVFYAKRGSKIRIGGLEDAKAVGRIGVYRDDYGELLLKNAGFENLRAAPNNEENLMDLVEGNIDLWIINELTGLHMAREFELRNQIEKVYDVQKEFMYIAFPKSTPDELIAEWQRTLDDIKEDGTYAEIFSTWLMFSIEEEGKPDEKLVLTEEEQAWLEEHPLIRVAVDPDFPPFQFTETGGEAMGIAQDYLELIGQKLGITFEALPAANWEQAQEMLKKREADLLAMATETEERGEYLLFTKPYMEFPDVLIGRNGGPELSSLEDLQGRSLAILPGFAVNAYLRENYPEIRLVEKADTLSLLRSVSLGEVDAGALNFSTTSYRIEQAQISNLKVIAELDFLYKPALASRSDWPILQRILDKALGNLSRDERSKISQKWISLSRGRNLVPKTRLDTLTMEERAWLAANPVIVTAPDPAWPPVEYFDELGNYSGMSSDYLKLLEEKLGVSFEVQRMKDWESVLEGMRSRSLDMTTAAVKTEDREVYMSFTEPYLQLPAVIIVERGFTGALTMEDLKGKTVSVVAGYSSYGYIEEHHPEIILDPVFNVVEGLRKVAYGKSFALVANAATSAHLMEQELITNLRVAGESGYTFDLSLASRSDRPILNSILQKGLDAISREEHHEIYDAWIAVPEEPWITLEQFLIGLAVLVGLCSVVGTMIWNRQLRHEVGLRTQELKASEEKFRNVYRTALVGLFRSSLDGEKLLAANPSFAALFGYEDEAEALAEFVPKNIYVNPADREHMVQRVSREGMIEEFEFEAKRRDGEVRSFLANALVSGDCLEGALLDITERKRSEEVIRQLALTDPLTGIANRNKFNASLEDAVAHSRRYGSQIGLLLIDLDDFKPVNDSYGHPVGDALLQHVSGLIRSSFREVDTAARIGGDEFAVVLHSLNSVDDARRLAETLLTRLCSPVEIEGQRITVGASMGGCLFPEHAQDVEGMLRAADKALYEAKAQGKNCICFA